MKKLISGVLLVCACVSLEGCCMWPYKTDFDFPVPQGEKCMSLYEVHKNTEAGKYGPETGIKKPEESSDAR